MSFTHHHQTHSIYFLMKKLLFVLILLPLVGCLSGVKDRVVEEKKEKVLYGRLENDEWGWYEDGDEKKDLKYVGEIDNGGPNGQGTLFSPDGDKYAGEIKDGYRNAQGTYAWSDGNKYVGEWMDGKYHGEGTFTSVKGYKYVGEWMGNKSWNGTEYDKNENIIGKFVDGVRIDEEVADKEQTRVLFRRKENQEWGWYWDGDEKKEMKYVGEIENGEPSGQGVLTSPYGDRYEGKFKDGKKHGQGTFSYSGRFKYVGEWKDGKSWNGTSYDKNGIIILKVVNGKFVVN